MPVASRIASRSVTRRHGCSKSIAPVEPTCCGDGAHERLEPIGDVVVVGVGLVELDHRELGVVLRRQALVAEVLAELVDALEAADDAALEVELGRDAQVQRAVQRVVVRRERARERAAVERLQDRRLDLDEAVVVEVAAHGGDDLGARDEQLARLLVGHEVELPAAVARLDVLQAVVLLGRRAQRLREHGEVVDPQRDLAALRAQRGAVDADDVAEVDLREQALVRARRRARPARACSCRRPERSTRSRNAILPWPRRAARRPATRCVTVGLLAGLRAPACAASTSATGSTPGNSCGKGSMPSARSLSSFARLTASSSSAIAASLAARRLRARRRSS